MSIDDIKQRIPEYAKDLKLNLGSVLSEAGAPGLSPRQILGTALAAAVAAGNSELTAAIEARAEGVLEPADLSAARAAAAIMAMNNVYYRFLHLVDDEEYAKLPAGLRMQVVGNPGVDKQDFELYALAVSAINGCGSCIVAHERTLRRSGLARQAVQSGIRIAAVVQAVAAVLAHPAPAAAASAAA